MKAKTAAVEQRAPSPAQLHRKACIDCGDTTGPFAPAGYVYTRGSEGGRLGWPVVACPEHGEVQACAS